MKHYTDKTHIKIIIISAVIIIFTFVCIIGYIDVNKRFSQGWWGSSIPKNSGLIMTICR